jgi:hypothetical protein
MSGARHRGKGDRVEREIIALYRALGINAERYPPSGASRFRGGAHDVDLYLFGHDEAPCVYEVKSRKNGTGFLTIDTWLAGFDNNRDPLVVVPWRIWARIALELGRGHS